MFLALLLVALGFLLIGVESKTTFVIGGFLHTQDIIECGLPFMTLFQVFLQGRDLGHELFDFLYMVSINTSTRGSICFIVRATRQGKQFITRCTNVMHRCITRSSTRQYSILTRSSASDHMRLTRCYLDNHSLMSYL